MSITRAFRILGWLGLISRIFCGLAAEPGAPSANRPPTAARWADFVEPGFPFFSSALDARNWGGFPATNNLTPRGIILNLGNQHWACFDTDLLRMSAMWTGPGVSAVSMARISYQNPGTKAPEGQEHLPQILGTPWVLNGIYPGWQLTEHFNWDDPREPGPDPAEIGRGPLPASIGRFRALRLLTNGVQLEYDVGGVLISERVSAIADSRRDLMQREFHLDRVPRPFWLLLGSTKVGTNPRVQISIADTTPEDIRGIELISQPNGFYAAHLPAMETPLNFRVSIGTEPAKFDGTAPRFEPQPPPPARWPQPSVTVGVTSRGTNAWEVDSVPLPVDNPWRRNVRLADLACFSDGRTAAVTFDGDVWMIEGLPGDLAAVRWRRFASGLHEPQSLVVRADELFVFDRNGIWRLRDTDGNGEADVHELFSNAFTQTAETREYAQSMKLAPDGSLIISKGGIQFSHLGRDNGCVLRIAPDGQSAQTIARGFRSPYLGVHPKTGVITASDQQGNYVPTTPIHLIRENGYYGFLSSLLPPEKYPAEITEPLLWIPYAVNASGASQVWLVDAKLGPLNDTLVHFGYYRPEIFQILRNETRPQATAAIVSITSDLEFPPFGGAINPVDGQLYFAGFQIFGTQARQLSGLGRLRYTGAPSPLPREVVAMNTGVLLRFDVPLDERTAVDPTRYAAEQWNYRRSSKYGSPHFRPDGRIGQEALIPSHTYLSLDRKSVYIGLPGLKPAMQLRVGWSIKSALGTPLEKSAYLSPATLPAFDPPAEGFAELTVDLTPRTANETPRESVQPESGKRVAELMGCVACHSTDGSQVGKAGPTWKGLFGSEVPIADGTTVKATETYLRESIQNPGARIVRGFADTEISMPSYEGVLTESQLEALVQYLKTL